MKDEITKLDYRIYELECNMEIMYEHICKEIIKNFESKYNIEIKFLWNLVDEIVCLKRVAEFTISYKDKKEIFQKKIKTYIALYRYLDEEFEKDLKSKLYDLKIKKESKDE